MQQTETKEWTTALKHDSAFLRRVVDATPGFVFVKDLEGHYTLTNKIFREFWKLSEEEIIGKTDDVLGYSPEEVKMFRLTDQEVIRSKKDVHIPLGSLTTPDGDIRWFQIVKSPIFNDEGEVEQVLVVGTEITERVMIERELKESEQNYKDIFQNVEEAIFMFDTDMIVLESNRAAMDLLEDKHIVGKFIGDFVHPESKVGVKEYLDQIRGKGSAKIEVNLLINGKKKTVEVNGSALVDELGEIIGSRDIVREITQAKIYEKGLIEARANAEDLNKLQANFLANMSHEIRTPINGIIGLAELIEQEFAATPGLSDYTVLLKESGHRLLATIVSILDFSKLSKENVELKLLDFDLVQRLSNYLPTMRVLADKKGLYLLFDCEYDEIPFRFDDNVLVLILNNLIGNAIKFTKEGGVEVKVERREIRDKDYILIEVRDSGIGISKEFLPHLFSPFRQESDGMNRTYGGTGLGLSIVKKYVELFGGFIKVESAKERGTSFKVFLPDSKAESAKQDVD